MKLKNERDSAIVLPLLSRENFSPLSQEASHIQTDTSRQVCKGGRCLEKEQMYTPERAACDGDAHRISIIAGTDFHFIHPEGLTGKRKKREMPAVYLHGGLTLPVMPTGCYGIGNSALQDRRDRSATTSLYPVSYFTQIQFIFPCTRSSAAFHLNSDIPSSESKISIGSPSEVPT